MPVVFPVDGSATRRSFPSAGSLGSVPQLHQYSGALRLPDALPALPRLPSAPRYLPMHVFSFPPRPMHWALRAWRLFPRFRRSGLFVDWRRQDLPSSQGTLVHSPRPQTPVGRVSQALSVLSGRPGAAFRHRDGVSHHNNQYFEAPSRGSRTRCLRFVAGLPFPTQDSLPAWCPPFSWAGLSPAGSLPRVSSGHRLTSSPQAGHSTYCRPANRLGLVDSWRTPDAWSLTPGLLVASFMLPRRKGWPVIWAGPGYPLTTCSGGPGRWLGRDAHEICVGSRPWCARGSRRGSGASCLRQ
jgi:hypothetical protein